MKKRKITNFLRSNIIIIVACTVVVLLAILMVVPPIIYLKRSSEVEQSIKNSNILQYFGMYLTFLGTLLLGVVSVWQTRVANKQNEKILKLSEAEFVPVISINQVRERVYHSCSTEFLPGQNEEITTLPTCDVDQSPCRCAGVLVTITNESKYPITKIKVQLDRYTMRWYKDAELDWYLPQHEKRTVNICTHPQFESDTIHLVFENAFNYQLKVDLIVEYKGTDTDIRYHYKLIS